MSITSYAQNFEDVMLWRALGHIARGSYIDIGAQDPIVDSVSCAFHERDWLGVHVEPTPHYAELLRQQRPGDIVIQAAIGNGPAVLRFFEIPNTGISTADANIAAQHRERGFDVYEIVVPSVTLSAVFEACAQAEIHWLKIDVEGFEEQVLSSWGTSAVRPWIVVIESTLPLTQIETHESWEPILIGYGYSPVYFDGLNRYYVSAEHTELKAAFASPPNVFDGFTLNGTASATFHKLIEARSQEKINEILAKSEQQRRSLQHEAERLNSNLSLLTETHAEHQHNWQQAEQALNEQNHQAKQELEALHRTQTQREDEIAVQLLDVQQQTSQLKADLAHSYSEQERALYRLHAEQEQALHQKLQALQEKLDQLQQKRTTREQTLLEQASRAKQEVENLLRTQVQREREVFSHLLAVQQQAAREKAELLQKQSKQDQALHRQQENWTQLEKVLNKEIATLQNETQTLHHAQQLQAQQHDLEISTKLEKHTRLLEACAAVKAQLQNEIQSEQQASLHLRQLLAQVQHSLEMTHTSLSWRITSPLRKLAEMFTSSKTQTLAPVSVNESITPEQGMRVATEPPPITVNQVSLEPTIPPLAQTTFLNMSTIASTLEELLACNGHQFVNCAYKTLLGRAPDPEGLGYYLGRLRTGISKIQILMQLCLSNEGKTYAAKLPGLNTAIQRYQKGRYPLIGWFFRQLNGAEGNHPTERKLRGIENQIFLLSDESNRRFNQLETTLAGLHNLVIQQTQSVVVSLGITPQNNLNVAPIAAIRPPEPDGLRHLSPRARTIYFQLKTAAAMHAGRAA